MKKWEFSEIVEEKDAYEFSFNRSRSFGSGYKGD